MKLGRKRDGADRQWFAWRPVYDERTYRWAWLEIVRKRVRHRQRTEYRSYAESLIRRIRNRR